MYNESKTITECQRQQKQTISQNKWTVNVPITGGGVGSKKCQILYDIRVGEAAVGSRVLLTSVYFFWEIKITTLWMPCFPC